MIFKLFSKKSGVKMFDHNIEWDEFDDEESRCRFVIESGLSPDDNFPWPFGDGENAQLFRAIFGEGLNDPAPETPCQQGGSLESGFPSQGRHSGTGKLNGCSDGPRPHDQEERITARQAINANSGMAFANWRYGLVFNTHLTIVYRFGGIENEKQAVRVLSRFTNEMSKWLGRQKLMDLGDPKRVFWNTCVLLYSHEHSLNKGFHTHLLTHVPLEVKDAFYEWAQQRLSSLMPGPTHPELLHISHSYGRSDWKAVGGQKRLVTYVLKGTDPTLYDKDTGRKLVDVLDIPYKWRRPAGRITTEKRVGLSHNISATARKKAGFQSCFDKGQDDRIYSGDELEEFEKRLKEPPDLML